MKKMHSSTRRMALLTPLTALALAACGGGDDAPGTTGLLAGTAATGAPIAGGKVDVACGCTVAEKPEQPIAPGKEGVIRASFDSRGRPGPNHKTLTVYANTSEQIHTLIFDVDVRGGK